MSTSFLNSTTSKSRINNSLNAKSEGIQRSSGLAGGYLPLVQQLKQFHAIFRQNRQFLHHLMQIINSLGKGRWVSLEDIQGCEYKCEFS